MGIWRWSSCIIEFPTGRAGDSRAGGGRLRYVVDMVEKATPEEATRLFKREGWLAVRVMWCPCTYG